MQEFFFLNVELHTGWTLSLTCYLGILLMLWEGGEESVMGCGVGKIFLLACG